MLSQPSLLSPRGAQLGDLHEVVHADAPEEGEARGEVVDGEARSQAGADVLQAVGQGVAEFDVGRGSRFLHVVAGDADAVEFGHLAGGVAEDVADDAHRPFGRVDVGVAHHVLFEDVVLDGAGQLLMTDALLLGSDDVEGHDGQHRAVHGHGDRHLSEINSPNNGSQEIRCTAFTPNR